jgi:hypothetical protein
MELQNPNNPDVLLNIRVRDGRPLGTPRFCDPPESCIMRARKPRDGH